MQPSKDLGANWRRRFFAIWGGQKLSWIGSGLATFALIWWLTDRTGSATVLAMGSLLSMLPAILLGPLTGALVDRWDRRWIMLIADGAIALISLWLAYLFWRESLQIWHVYVIMFARSLGSAFHDPAINASTTMLVPKEKLPRIQGLNSALIGAVNVISPPLGALLINWLPLHWIMGIDVISAIFAMLPLLFIDIPQPERPKGDAVTFTVWDDMREGLRYVWNRPGLRMMFFLPSLLKIALMPAISLIPILVTQHFGGEALELGWMNAIWGAGMVLGGLLLSAWGGFRRHIVTSLMGLIGVGIGSLIVGIAPTTAFGLGLTGMFLVGVMLSLTDGPLTALLQTIVPQDKQGRVFGVVMSAFNLATPVGMAVGGPISDAFGVHILYILSGVTCIGTAVVAFLTPSVMHLEDDDSEPAPPSGAHVQLEVGVE
jgi:DHA3 family macrolide efflux protein-like MFS transporter